MTSRTFRPFSIETDPLDYKTDYNKEETAALRSAMKEKSAVSLDDLRRWRFGNSIELLIARDTWRVVTGAPTIEVPGTVSPH